jgi:hypothetical protein
MKILLLILLLPLYAIAQKEGHLVVSQSKQNFGKISLFDVLNKRMEVGAKYWCKNTGKVPIFINACQTGDGGCYCYRWPKEPILPGDSNVVSLVLDVSYPRLWDKSGTIIYSEEGIEYSARVYLKGEVYNDATQISYTNYTVDTSAEKKLEITPVIPSLSKTPASIHLSYQAIAKILVATITPYHYQKTPSTRGRQVL